MLKIKIISIGKIKEKSLVSLLAEYEKRLSKYIKFENVILNDLPCQDNMSQNEIELLLKKEAVNILKILNEKAYIISMCIEGKKLSSTELADKLKSISMNNSEIDIIIGSSYGLCDEIKKKSDLLLSMSDMTFPHNLAKLMITEQIYRALKINNNEIYHK